MSQTITVIPGDGIGRKVADATIEVIAVIDTVILANQSRSVDVGGGASTRQYAEALVRALA